MKWIVLGLSLALSSANGAFAEEMPVPPKLQAALFQKIFGYDKALGSVGAAKVLVVFPDASPAAKDEITKSFSDSGVAVSTVKSSGLSGSIGGANVVYFLPGTATAQSKQLCVGQKALPISGVPSLAESGIVAVALDISGDKPRIVVNLATVKSVEHQISPDLLKLAKVIQ